MTSKLSTLALFAWTRWLLQNNWTFDKNKHDEMDIWPRKSCFLLYRKIDVRWQPLKCVQDTLIQCRCRMDTARFQPDGYVWPKEFMLLLYGKIDAKWQPLKCVQKYISQSLGPKENLHGKITLMAKRRSKHLQSPNKNQIKNQSTTMTGLILYFRWDMDLKENFPRKNSISKIGKTTMTTMTTTFKSPAIA